jgi:hypothetical protein
MIIQGNQLYYGVTCISDRYRISKTLARRWLKSGKITAWKDGEGPNSSWVTTEELVLQDLDRLARENLPKMPA